MQHLEHDGQCAICGDEYGAEYRPHEVPGEYATGIIGRSYFTPGQVIKNIKNLIPLNQLKNLKLIQHRKKMKF